MVKGREEQCAKVVEVLSRVAACRSDIENNIFINDEIHKYRQMVQAVTATDTIYHSEAQALDCQSEGKEEDGPSIKLLRRVTFRALEILSNSVGQLNPKHSILMKEAGLLKNGCIRILNNENCSQKVQQMIRYLNKYQLSKKELYVGLLSSVSDALENGDQQELERLKKNYCFSMALPDHCESTVSSSMVDTVRGRVKLNHRVATANKVR